jgi:EAL domain-containing protein (putative c-di-GMP-specific phosphodiesterase class I)
MLVLRVLQILGETGLSPKRLEIEISEDALVGEIIAAKEALAAFHAAGVRIALDDFGTGNSSLHHLRECRFDRLKIDRSLVGTMLDSGEDATFVNAVLGLSRELHLEVTAEGIEKDGLVESLRAHGCAEGQGFRFSKAVPANEALLLIGRAKVEVAV